MSKYLQFGCPWAVDVRFLSCKKLYWLLISLVLLPGFLPTCQHPSDTCFSLASCFVSECYCISHSAILALLCFSSSFLVMWSDGKTDSKNLGSKPIQAAFNMSKFYIGRVVPEKWFGTCLWYLDAKPRKLYCCQQVDFGLLPSFYPKLGRESFLASILRGWRWWGNENPKQELILLVKRTGFHFLFLFRFMTFTSCLGY